jgi:hypothetical protein
MQHEKNSLIMPHGSKLPIPHTIPKKKELKLETISSP